MSAVSSRTDILSTLHKDKYLSIVAKKANFGTRSIRPNIRMTFFYCFFIPSVHSQSKSHMQQTIEQYRIIASRHQSRNSFNIQESRKILPFFHGINERKRIFILK